MTNAITDYFAALQQRPPWRMIDVVQDYNETDQLTQNVQPDSTVRAFYESTLESFTAELEQIEGVADATPGSSSHGGNETEANNT